MASSIQLFLNFVLFYSASSKYLPGILALDPTTTSSQQNPADSLTFDTADPPLKQLRQRLLDVLAKGHQNTAVPDMVPQSWVKTTKANELGNLPEQDRLSLADIIHSGASVIQLGQPGNGQPLHRIARSTARSFHFPLRTTLVIKSPKCDRKNYTTHIFIGVQSTVLSTLIDATRNYLRNHGAGENPYNVNLQFIDDLDCYIINEALGRKNSDTKQWRITVKSYSDEVIYDDLCLPFDLTLRPDSMVIISYLPAPTLW